MKRILISLFIAALAVVFNAQKTDAYEITWGDDWWRFGAGWVDNETGYGIFTLTEPTIAEDIDIEEEIGASGYAYTQAWTSAGDEGGPHEIGSFSEAYSGQDGEWADAESLAGLYNTFTLSDSGGGDIPYWLDVNLYGYLEGSLGGSSNELGYYARIWIEESGTIWDNIGGFGFEDMEALIFGEMEGMEDIEAVWSSGVEKTDYDDDEDVEELQELLRYASEGQEYEIIALLGTYAYAEGDAYAYSAFNGDTFEFGIEPAHDIPPIPEPGSMLLFGLGALGLGAIKNKKGKLR